MKKKHIDFDSLCERVFFVFVAAVILFISLGLFFIPEERQTDIFEYESLRLDWYRLLPDGEKTPVEVPCKLEFPPG